MKTVLRCATTEKLGNLIALFTNLECEKFHLDGFNTEKDKRTFDLLTYQCLTTNSKKLCCSRPSLSPRSGQLELLEVRYDSDTFVETKPGAS